MSVLEGCRLVHVTSSDMSLALLLGPQLRAFAQAGMVVYGASAPGPFVAQLEDWGVRHVPLRHSTRSLAPGKDFLACAELAHALRRLRPHVVHTHNPKPGIYGRVLARLCRVPVVVNTVHGLYATAEDGRWRRAAVWGLERLAAGFSDAELVQSVEDLVTLARLGVARPKLQLLGNGVDTARFRPGTTGARRAARARFGARESQVVVGTVGRLVWEKGLGELAAAARLLAHQEPQVVFVVVGGPDPAKADSLSAADLERLGAAGNVRLLGHCHDVEDLYPGFDVYCLASRREGFPRSVMEAAACGLPAVVSDVRGCRQAVEPGRTGVLVPPGRPDLLAGALAGLARDPARRLAMGQAARRKAERHFDHRRVIEDTLATYARLLARSP
ncbi:MAG TPA: glycosyltransferase family 4 protein [Acidimicrobiales bacterium]|nr:glycosyltransferase family 4 protein [Acidimicrobiales bacterium]